MILRCNKHTRGFALMVFAKQALAKDCILNSWTSMCNLMSSFTCININVHLLHRFNVIHLCLFFCGWDSSSQCATADEAQSTALIPRSIPPTNITFKVWLSYPSRHNSRSTSVTSSTCERSHLNPVLKSIWFIEH